MHRTVVTRPASCAANTDKWAAPLQNQCAKPAAENNQRPSQSPGRECCRVTCPWTRIEREAERWKSRADRYTRKRVSRLFDGDTRQQLQSAPQLQQRRIASQRCDIGFGSLADRPCALSWRRLVLPAVHSRRRRRHRGERSWGTQGAGAWPVGLACSTRGRGGCG